MEKNSSTGGEGKINWAKRTGTTVASLTSHAQEEASRKRHIGKRHHEEKLSKRGVS